MASRIILSIFSLAILISVVFVECVDSLNSLSDEEKSFTIGRSSGIDLSPINFEFQYSNDIDYQNYGLLSSYSCCDTVNRPETLWIIDGMLNKEQQIGITIQNSGSVTSGQFDLRVYIEHNEYDEFLIFDQTIQVGSIASSSSKMVYLNWIPDYSGNHTIHAITLHPQDDDLSNDLFSRHYTVGYLYENANGPGIWSSMSNYWSIDQDTGLTPHDFSTINRNSFYVGDISSTSYGNNWNENMESDILNLEDRVLNPQKSFQISFLASGASRAGDYLNLQIQNSPGNWKSIGSISTTIDTSAANWNLFNYNLNPVDMNSNSKLRFNFDSNSVNTEVGYWIDDFAMVYDQAARNEEYNPMILSLDAGEASADEWSIHEVEILNDGNLEDKLSFDVLNLPLEWDWSIGYKNGGPIDNQIGMVIPKGESRTLELKIKPAEDSILGLKTLMLNVYSINSPGVSADSKEFDVDVLPTYLPEFEFDADLGYCRPGNFCEFNVSLTNAGDVSDTFSITSDIILIRNGWSFGLSWNQETQLYAEPGETIAVRMSVDIPLNSIAGQFSSILLTATSDARPDISNSIRVNATAGMISNAFFSVDFSNLDSSILEPLPGSNVELPFTLWNNASTFDIYEVCFFRSGYRSWLIESETSGSIFSEGDSCENPHIFEVQGFSNKEINVFVNVPENAQSGDSGPIINPIIKSMRSGDSIQSILFDDFSVKMVSNLTAFGLDSSFYLTPGSENVLTFEISNFGNGADLVSFDVKNLVYDWEYWFSDGQNIIDSYELSPYYEGNSNVELYLHLLIPSEISGQTSIDFDISVLSSLYESELDLSDNMVSFNGLTAMVFTPEWVIYPIDKISTEAGTQIELNATLINSGNSFDNNLRIKFELESNSDISKLNVFLKIPFYGDEYFTEGEWASIPLDNNQLVGIEILVMIPSDFKIPTKFDIIWLVEGGSNQLGNSLNLTNVTSIDVSLYRDVSVDFSLDSGVFSPLVKEYFSVEFSSSSSIIEELLLEFKIPSEWKLVCEDPSNDGEFKVVIPAANSGGIRKSRLDCNIDFGEKPGLNLIEFDIVDSDGNVIYSLELEIALENAEINGVFSSFFDQDGVLKGLLITFSGVILVLFCIIIIQRMSDKYEEEEIIGTSHTSHVNYNEYKQNNNVHLNQNIVHSQPQVYQKENPVQNIFSNVPVVNSEKSNFSRPQSRPPQENKPVSLEDAFGSLMGDD